jgi:hypothetical protein
MIVVVSVREVWCELLLSINNIACH